MIEQALLEIRAAKQEEEQRLKSELTSSKKQLREYETGAHKKDQLIEELRFANRSLTAEVVELKKDSACMGQMLEDETN